MSITDDLLEEVTKHFDSVGIVAEEDESGVALILGLATTPERDLDDFALNDGQLVFRGWEKHMKPKLDAVKNILRKKGFEAENVGWLGYPRTAEIMHLKRLAVMGGLGRQGKNTLILHPKFGPWLRFAAVHTNAPFSPTGPGTYELTENDLCRSCEACLLACPVAGLLEPYRLLDPPRCRANIHSDGAVDKIKWCDCCLGACPIGK